MLAHLEQCTSVMTNQTQPKHVNYTSETARLAIKLAENAVDELELELSHAGSVTVRQAQRVARLRTSIANLKSKESA